MVCIACIATRLARRVLGVLLWLLLVPMAIAMVISPVFLPAFRFEITFARFCCFAILFLTVFWYEFLEPCWVRYRAWQRERRKIGEMASAKCLKNVKRMCPSCGTAYMDQSSPKWDKKKKCERCGVISKNSKKKVQGFGNGGKDQGIWRWFLENVRYEGREAVGEGMLLDKTSLNNENGESKMTISEGEIRGDVSLGENSEGEGEGLSMDNTSQLVTAEEVSDDKNSKREKARRKAEEKKKAREIKEKAEEEERKNKEEMTKLVQEVRRLKEKECEARIESTDKDREDGKSKDVERRKKKGSASSKDKESSDGEAAKKRVAYRESKKNSDMSGGQEMKKLTVEKANLTQSARDQNATKVGGSKYPDHSETQSRFPSSGFPNGGSGAKVSKQTKSGDRSYSSLHGSPARPRGSQLTMSSIAMDRVQHVTPNASNSSLVDTHRLIMERGPSNLRRANANQRAIPLHTLGHQRLAMGSEPGHMPWTGFLRGDDDIRYRQNDTSSVTGQQTSPPNFKQGCVPSGSIGPLVNSNLSSTDSTPFHLLDGPSQFVPFVAADRVNATLHQDPSTTESWVPLPASLHRTLGTNEPGNFQMQSTQQFHPSEHDYVGDQCGSPLDSTQAGDHNDDEFSSLSSDHMHLLPSCLLDISSSSSAERWENGQGEESGDTVEQGSQGPQSGFLYTSAVVNSNSIWSSNKSDKSWCYLLLLPFSCLTAK